MLCWRWAL